MEEGSEREPLLLPSSSASEPSTTATFVARTGELGDIAPIRTPGDFWHEFKAESRKLWYLAAPAIFMSVCGYSLGAITQIFAGHIGTLELAAVTLENSDIAGLSLGVLMGMGSALETLCGQAWGAGQHDMLGVYLQRSWLILLATALLLTPLYVFAGPLLSLIGQQESIASAAGTFSIWMIPQLFAYALHFPISKFLQAQSKMVVMTWATVAGLVFHVFFTWLLVVRLDWGLPALALVLNAAWWVIVLVQFVYIVGGGCRKAWHGFSWKAFHSLWGFVRLSLASAVMICLEVWYFMILILFAGYLKNAEVSLDGLSVCMNILGWAMMVSFGWNAATSVRISNELGAGHPRTAKFSVVVVVLTSFVIGVAVSLILILTRNQYPSLFTNSDDVKRLVIALTPLLATSVTVNNVQPVLSGVAIGAGWQALVAYVNIGCYYIFGVPLGLVLGYVLDLGVEGIWYGMLMGTVVQTLVLFWLVYRTDWNNEASVAGARIRQWGGESDEAEK